MSLARSDRSALRGAWLSSATLLTAVAATVLLLLAGCASTGGISSQSTLRSADSVGLAPAAVEPVPVAADWWKGFQDPQLDALVERALADSPSLAQARTRVQAALAAVATVTGNDLPRVDASADLTRQRFTENGLYPPPLGGSVRNTADLRATLSWDLDLYGRHAAELAGAVGQQRAAEADVAAARLALASRVAQTYFELGRLQAQRDVAERTLDQRSALLDLTRQRVGAGLDTNVELRQGEGSLPEVRLQIAQLDEQMTLTRHALAALTGQPVKALDALAPRLAAAQPPALPQSMPAGLLGWRPDVIAARWRVESAARGVDVARTAFYPSVNLVAFAGLNSIGFDELFVAGSRNFGVGPAIRLPIFDGGRLRAQLQGRAAEADTAVEAYNATVLDAARDAADQIASVQAVARQQAEQQQAQNAAESAYDLALQRYRAGLGTYLVVLSAESQVLAQRRAAADLQARALLTRVQLARALGGGAAGDLSPPPVASLSQSAPRAAPSAVQATPAR